MNYSKIAKKAAGVAMFIGFLLVLGGVGTADLADDMHKQIAFFEYAPPIIVGLILMIPGFYMFQEDEEGEDYK